jgi:hypothetical protein
VRRLGPAEIGDRAAEIGLLYAEAYRDPPYNEGDREAAAFLKHLPSQHEHPGFCFVATESPDGGLTGFVFGYTFPPGRWWRPASEEPGHVRDLAKFAVMELVVRHTWRERGLAKALMAELLSDRVEPYATLCANPQSVARAIYRSWGWQPAGTLNPPEVGPMDILIKGLNTPQ